LISDYTKNGRSIKGSFWGSFAGYFFGSSLMFIIGLVTGFYAGTSDPISILANLNMGFAALLIVILATVTTTFMDVYSGVLSTLNLAPKLSRKKLIIIYTALGTILAIYFPMEQYINFLYMIGSLFAPAFSVILVDYFFYKKDRAMDSINTLGVIAAVIGTASYYVVTRYDLIIGSSVPSMIITVAVYVSMRAIEKKLKTGDEKYANENC
jgi:purine-cytosine permease-like protein